MKTVENDRAGQMVKLTGVQKHSLELLIKFDDVCRKNNLRYFIIGGTLLGAVRHKGFIPWDDDIDVAMPRKDYEYLIEHFAELVSKPYYVSNFKISDNKFDIHRMAAFFKTKEIKISIQNNGETLKEDLGIDVLPIDGMPDNKLLRKIHIYKLLLLRCFFKMLSIDLVEIDNGKKRNDIEAGLIRLAKKIRLDKKIDRMLVLKKLDKELMKYDMDSSNVMCGTFLGAYKDREIVDCKYFRDMALFDFENLQFPGPKFYDGYLHCIYGDYMQLPPVEKRVGDHKFTIIENDGEK